MNGDWKMLALLAALLVVGYLMISGGGRCNEERQYLADLRGDLRVAEAKFRLGNNGEEAAIIYAKRDNAINYIAANCGDD